MKEVLESIGRRRVDKINEKLKQEFSVCQHFFNGNEMEKGRHRVFNIKLTEFIEKLKEVFEKLNLAAKNSALGYLLRNVDTDEYQYFHAVEKMQSFAVEKIDFVETCA